MTNTGTWELQPDASLGGIWKTWSSGLALVLLRLHPVVPVEERIADWKSRAKEAFAKEDYVTALSLYRMVIQINPLDASMFANNSLCWLRLRHGVKALEDAHKCRLIRPRWSKAWKVEKAAEESRCMNKGKLCLDYNGAADAFRQAMQLDPGSEEIRDALRKAEKAAEESRHV
ncbi:hypothetical protein QYE76_061414 [Lolium multiflorum]|uniref:Uncharacterized protein n=1 Tax=Lolium multiflorum TaxID=4521 RepID=A0AAD8W755_LOLMU|nr:hypothetical protein QYE76_061414 [Lolium multiflorum]